MIQTSFPKSIGILKWKGFMPAYKKTLRFSTKISPVCVLFYTIKITKKPDRVFRVFPGVFPEFFRDLPSFSPRGNLQAMRPSPTFNSIIDAVLAASGF